jgi:hypothetical protein
MPYTLTPEARALCERIASHNVAGFSVERCECGEPITLEMERDVSKCVECQRQESVA